MNTPTTIISLIQHTLNVFLKKVVDNFFIFKKNFLKKIFCEKFFDVRNFFYITHATHIIFSHYQHRSLHV